MNTIWLVAAGVVVFIGLVIVVMTLLKRRRFPDDDEEGILAMDDEDVPSSSDDEVPPEEKIADEAMGEKVKRPWPWAKIAVGLGAFGVIFVGYSAIYSFSTITDLENSVTEVNKRLARKVERGSFDSLGATVADLKSTTEGLTSKMEDTRGRLAAAEEKLKVVEREMITVGNVANNAYSTASRAATKVVKLDEKVTRETGEIKRTLTTHSNLIRTGFARQDSINTFLASKFSISPAEMDSLAIWFSGK